MLHHACIPIAFREFAIMTKKNNVMTHTTTRTLPHKAWLTSQTTKHVLFPCGTIGCISIQSTKPKSKLAPRARHARYLQPVDAYTIEVLLTDSNVAALTRYVDLHPLNPALDSITNLHRTFKISFNHPKTSHITSATAPPRSTSQVCHYTDDDDWSTTHNIEFDQLKKQKEIQSLDPEYVQGNCQLACTSSGPSNGSLRLDYRVSRFSSR